MEEKEKDFHKISHKNTKKTLKKVLLQLKDKTKTADTLHAVDINNNGIISRGWKYRLLHCKHSIEYSIELSQKGYI